MICKNCGLFVLEEMICPGCGTGLLDNAFDEEVIIQSDVTCLEISADCLIKLMKEFEVACEELDIDVMEKIRDELRGYSYPDSMADKMDRLCAAIDVIDLDNCIELASIIIDML